MSTEHVVLFAAVFVVAFAFGMGPTLPKLVREVWRHGFDNHRCNVRGCCR